MKIDELQHSITDPELPIEYTQGNEPRRPLEQIPHPVETADRIQTVDLVRGFALLGILLMNIPLFGIDESVFYYVLSASHKTTDFRTMAVIFTFFDGTMRSLFSMLFGAGMILFTLNKKEIPGGVTVAE